MELNMHVFAEFRAEEDTCAALTGLLAAADSERVESLVAKNAGLLHVSVSRPLTVTPMTADSILDALRTALHGRTSFELSFDSAVEEYVNDERTRAFLACNVRRGFRNLQEITVIVDRVLARFGLPPFHDPPRFHASFAAYAPGQGIVPPPPHVRLHDPDEPFWVSSICCRIAQEIHRIKIG